MVLLGDIIWCIIALVFLSMPILWIIIFYYKIKCRKVENCTKRKCKFWAMCDHNEVARRQELLEYLRQKWMRETGVTEEEWREMDRKREEERQKELEQELAKESAAGGAAEK